MIKALYDYKAPTDPPHYLSFSQGDFLHVVGRENDADWYEACNPLHGARGLVPVRYFETIGKTVRDSRGSTNSAGTTHDSGYAEAGKNHISVTSNGTASHDPMTNRMSKSMGKPGGASVYGIVSYDFHAERPDELEAKEGEAIIVIAQSNPEWFVAKPITRLGGPGLIPVSFIEIKDMHTGQTVTDPQEAIQRAGIPRVEEWKKMAADYKNTSIPLGQFGNQTSIPQGQTYSNSGLEQGMGRMSIGQGPPDANGYAYAHSRTPSSYTAQTQHQRYPHAPVSASCIEYVFQDDKFHFIVSCALANGSNWVLSRIYEDFYELQINLINSFPEEAGKTGEKRTLPYMPGPVQFVTDKISEGRRETLDQYLKQLLEMGPHITQSTLMRNFFAPREGDFEGGDEGDAQGQMPDRYSTASYQQQPQARQSGQYQPQHWHHPSAGSAAFGHQRNQSSIANVKPQGQGQGHYRTPSEFTQSANSSNGALAPPMLRQQTQTSTGTGSSGAAAPQAMKVKVWFDRETCVVLRMPGRGAFGFEELYRKIIERRRLEYRKGHEGGGEGGDREGEGETDGEEGLHVEFRDESSGDYYPLETDEDLEAAVERNEKLTLVVRADE